MTSSHNVLVGMIVLYLEGKMRPVDPTPEQSEILERVKTRFLGKELNIQESEMREFIGVLETLRWRAVHVS